MGMIGHKFLLKALWKYSHSFFCENAYQHSLFTHLLKIIYYILTRLKRSPFELEDSSSSLSLESATVVSSSLPVIPFRIRSTP